MEWVWICPAHAFSETESQSFVIDGKAITYSIHDNIRMLE